MPRQKKLLRLQQQRLDTIGDEDVKWTSIVQEIKQSSLSIQIKVDVVILNLSTIISSEIKNLLKNSIVYNLKCMLLF